MPESKPDHFAGEDSPKVRSHLANERTFLACLRTAIGIMAFGFLVARLRFELNGHQAASAPYALRAERAGILFVALGLVAVIVATYHYSIVRHQIQNDTYTPSPVYMTMFGLFVILLGLGVIALIAGLI